MYRGLTTVRFVVERLADADDDRLPAVPRFEDARFAVERLAGERFAVERFADERLAVERFAVPERDVAAGIAGAPSSDKPDSASVPASGVYDDSSLGDS